MGIFSPRNSFSTDTNRRQGIMGAVFGKNDPEDKPYASTILGEFFGTVTFFVALGQVADQDYVVLAVIYMMIVSCFSRYSGAHLNPALSFGKFLAEKLNFIGFLGYFISQVFGVLVSRLINVYVLSNQNGVFHQNMFDVQKTDLIWSFLACILAAFCYIYVFLLVCEKSDSKVERTEILGFVYAFGHLISSEFNPAVGISGYLLELIQVAIDGSEVFPGYYSVVLGPIGCVAGACLAITLKK